MFPWALGALGLWAELGMLGLLGHGLLALGLMGGILLGRGIMAGLCVFWGGSMGPAGSSPPSPGMLQKGLSIGLSGGHERQVRPSTIGSPITALVVLSLRGVQIPGRVSGGQGCRCGIGALLPRCRTLRWLPVNGPIMPSGSGAPVKEVTLIGGLVSWGSGRFSRHRSLLWW